MFDDSWKSENLIRADLLDIADPGRIDSVLSVPLGAVFGSSPRSTLFSLRKLSSTSASQPVAPGHSDKLSTWKRPDLPRCATPKGSFH